MPCMTAAMVHEGCTTNNLMGVLHHQVGLWGSSLPFPSDSRPTQLVPSSCVEQLQSCHSPKGKIKAAAVSPSPRGMQL